LQITSDGLAGTSAVAASGAEGTVAAAEASEPAIDAKGLSKVYTLYPSPRAQIMDLLGLYRLLHRRRPNFAQHAALNGINLTIGRGERVGVVGRNGAGKTTLLKLITRAAEPSSGSLVVSGDVQALMQVGLGFHPEFTGRENIRASLLYSGLPAEERRSVEDDIISFCELGEYLEQPLKTYSLGMQSRLQFACATAIEPEILIVDEILGAGDAYFSAKSALRMERLTKSGCTLLLVSHSMAQILQFCERVIWVDRGEIVEDGDALPVVKAYERWMRERSTPVTDQQSAASAVQSGGQDHGVSRWPSAGSELLIHDVRVLDRDGKKASILEPGSDAAIEVDIRALKPGTYEFSVTVLIMTTFGVQVAWARSPNQTLTLEEGKVVTLKVLYEPLQLNGGDYVISAAVFEHFDALRKNSLKRYDLVARSYQFSIGDAHDGNPAVIRHPTRWAETGYRE
jgi:lipopolysaccharide transport system ATP-binding protein